MLIYQANFNSTKPITFGEKVSQPAQEELSVTDRVQKRQADLVHNHELYAYTRKRVIKKMAELDVSIQAAATAAQDINFEHPVRTADNSETMKALIKENFSPGEIDLLSYMQLDITDEEIAKTRNKAAQKTPFDYLSEPQKALYKSIKNKIKKYLRVNNTHKDIDRLNTMNDIHRAACTLEYDYISSKKLPGELEAAETLIQEVGLTEEEAGFLSSSLFPVTKLQHSIAPPKPAHWIIN